MAVPATPAAPSPSDGALSIANTTDLLWGDVAGADTYDVYLDTVNPPLTLVSSAQPGRLYNPPTDLSYATTYYWKIVATNIDGSTSGPVWSFTTDVAPATPPLTPADPYPGNTQTNISLTPTLTWFADSLASTYSIQFDTVNPPALAASGLTSATYTPTTLSPFTTYYWKITSTGAGGSTAGPVWSFTTGATPPTGGVTEPSNPSPANRQNYVDTNPILTWEADSGIFYDVYFGTVSPPPLVASNLTSKTYTPTGPLSTTTYYWQVVAKRGSYILSADGDYVVSAEGDRLVTADYANLATSPIWRFLVGTYVTPRHSKQWSIHMFNLKVREEEKS